MASALSLCAILEIIGYEMDLNSGNHVENQNGRHDRMMLDVLDQLGRNITGIENVSWAENTTALLYLRILIPLLGVVRTICCLVVCLISAYFLKNTQRLSRKIVILPHALINYTSTDNVESAYFYYQKEA